MADQGALQRRLGLSDAVVIGAGSMIGAGVFAAWAPAAEAAGSGLLIGLVLAGLVAWCNATSSAQLAAIHPESGGTYVYGRRQLGPVWGHLAGWGFVVGKVPAEVLGATDAPLQAVVDAAGRDALAPLVRIGAAIASLGVLLNLVPGVSRTALAMARRRELPAWFDHVDGRRNLPLRAETTVVIVVGVLVSWLGLRSAIALSGTAVLTYYAITNASALTLRPEQRRWPRWIAAVGLVGCLALALALPWRELASGAAVLGVGAIGRLLTVGRSTSRD